MNEQKLVEGAKIGNFRENIVIIHGIEGFNIKANEQFKPVIYI